MINMLSGSPGKEEPLCFLFQSFFQGCGAQGGQMYPLEAVFCRQHKGFWQIVTGNDLTFLLRPIQKFPGALGGGGIVHIKNTDDGRVPHRHIVADVQVHLFLLVIASQCAHWRGNLL